jgi:hypothetical protein
LAVLCKKGLKKGCTKRYDAKIKSVIEEGIEELGRKLRAHISDNITTYAPTAA